MKHSIPEHNPEVYFDKKGKPLKVLLDFDVYEQLLECAEGLEDQVFGAIAQAVLENESEFLSHEEVKMLIEEDEED